MKKTLLFIFLSFLGTVSAQEKNQVTKPKIGLVLSGGGAKGSAHIGVLKVIDSLGIKIDYIAGTSAGAIVGGLYASGYSASQIDSLFRKIDFDKVIADKMPRASQSFYDKEKADRYILTLPFHNKTVGIPKAMSKGQNFFNLLSDLTRHVHDVTDFNKLPIPFACIATDLETGKGIVLNKGFLPEAIRASSSFPSLLDPVIIDGKMLSDGGIISNYPIKILKEMGADIIIGVDVQDSLLKQEDLQSATAILMQIVSFGMYADMKKNIEMTNIYIKPDSISNYTVTDFDKYEVIYKLGHKSALENIAALKKLSSDYKKLDNKKIIVKVKDSIIVNKFTFNGSSSYTNEYLQGKLKIKTPDIVSVKNFKSGINNLVATKNFNSIYYRFKNNNEVAISLKENPDKEFIKLGAHYDNLSQIGILLNYTIKNPLGKNDFFALDLIVGNNLRYELDYFIDNGFHWSYGIKSKLTSINTNIPFQAISGGSTGTFSIDLHSIDISNQLYMQTSFDRKYNMKIGVEHEYLNVFSYDLSTNSNKFYLDKNHYFNIFSELKMDTYDALVFPKKGLYLSGFFKWYLLSSNDNNLFASFSQAKVQFGYVKSLGGFSFHLTSDAGITIGNSGNLFNYHLGGSYDNLNYVFVPFYGYDFTALNDVSYVRSGLDIRYEFKKNQYFILGAQAARATPDILNDGDLFADTKYGFKAGFAMQTFIGPIGINYTRSPQLDEGYWHFNLGYSF